MRNVLLVRTGTENSSQSFVVPLKKKKQNMRGEAAAARKCTGRGGGDEHATQKQFHLTCLLRHLNYKTVSCLQRRQSGTAPR